MQADTAAIDCRDLTKIYDHHVTAVHDLTLAVPRSTSFGILGQNGAGKSTLVRLIMGFISPTGGSIRVLGEQVVARAHPHVGYVHERVAFEPRFTGEEHLRFLAVLCGISDSLARRRCAELIDRVHLTSAARRRVGDYSKGMLQRLAIAQALITDPELLILDEPTSGLDPGGQLEVRQLLRSLRQERKTIVLCSHYLPEIEELCDDVGVLHRGQLVATASVSGLHRTTDAIEIVLGAAESAASVVARLGLGQMLLQVDGRRLLLKAEDQLQVLAQLVSEQVPIESLRPLHETLEELYVRAIGRSGVSLSVSEPTSLPVAEPRNE